MNIKHFSARNVLAGYVITLALAVASAVCLLPNLAHAQPTRQANHRVLGASDATAGTTFATTSYADLTGATLTFVPSRDYATTEAPGSPSVTPHVHVIFNADVTKATATTGTCAVFANGAVITKTARSIASAAGTLATMTIFADVTEATSGSQVVKIQCKSGDTNVFTVNQGVFYVEEFY